jgi:Na+/H+ antiporter NhaC
VVVVALSGSPDERGFWPILIMALCLGLLLARERQSYCQSVIEGMSQPIVMIMITAWMLASVIGVLMSISGLVEGLAWVAQQLHLGSVGIVVMSFLICCAVAVSTGTSFGTILICGPILFPAGCLLGAHGATLAGAIIGGATFGDCIAPISDTTIASALSQGADIGGTVRSRLKYVLPATAAALILYTASASIQGQPIQEGATTLAGDPRGLPMLLVPVVIIVLLLRGRHLLHGLLYGVLAGVCVALVFGLISWQQVFSLDPDSFTARSFIIDGINRAVGISFFTILLLGLVATIKASGLLARLVSYSARHSVTLRQTETWISMSVGVVVLLTCHSIVAVLTVGEYAKQTGERVGIHPYRRANLLSLVVCTFPFLLPYFIPVILMANTTASGADYGIDPVSPLQAGLHNFFSAVLLLMVLLAVSLGYGRRSDSKAR